MQTDTTLERIRLHHAPLPSDRYSPTVATNSLLFVRHKDSQLFVLLDGIAEEYIAELFRLLPGDIEQRTKYGYS